MLDSDTKRRINTCRDILVGKVPDPKSQVEQITIALIYKFMDDMDLEAEELGGERSFFTGDFERYRWSKLVAPGVGGQEMLNLYTEALTKMVENPDLPELFRSIFRNAYLPYRDPETLRSFLREINGFTYDHSERLGDAFEYLLSVLGSQGDAGQFRTPRHIIDFMVEIIDPQKNEVILDPACGTAGFLISAYKHILKQNTTGAGNGNGSAVEGDAAEQALESPQRYKGDLLTPDERARLARNIKGYDISPDMVRLSRVNMFLHAFKEPLVEEYDTLTSEDKWGESADVILANPPFMSPKGGIIPHNKFKVSSKRSEVLFVDYIAEHLTPNGRAAIVVPEGIIFQSQSAYVALRKMLVESHLAAVISLPAGVFNPYSGVKTSILILDRAVAKASKHVAFFKVDNDGFALGAQRKAVKGSQLAQVKAELGTWLQAARAGRSDKLESPLGFSVPRGQIAEDQDFHLNAERYKTAKVKDSHWPLVAIGSICDLVNGRAFKPEDWEEAASGGLPIIRIQNLNNASASLNYFSGEVRDRFIVKTGDLLFSWSGSRGSSFGAHLWEGPKAILNQHIFNVKFDETRIDKMYLLHILNAVVDQVEESLHGGVGLVHITKGNLEKIEIPLPPFEVQREISAEVESYKRVIDGARAVLAYYRPRVPSNPEWPVVELRDVINGKPKNGYSGSPVQFETGTKVLSLSATTSGTLDLTKFKYLDEEIPEKSEFRCRKNDIYLQRGNTPDLVGTAAIFDADDQGYIYPDLMIRVQADTSKVVSEYLLATLQAPEAREFMRRNASGAAGSMPKINQEIVNRIPIPLPPIDEQERIVAELKSERGLVECNRELVSRFESKIDAVIARVWGAPKEQVAT